MKMVRLLKHIYVQHKNLRQQLILISKFLFLIEPEENGQGTRKKLLYNQYVFSQINTGKQNDNDMRELFENQFYSSYLNHTTVPGITFDMTNEILFLH